MCHFTRVAITIPFPSEKVFDLNQIINDSAEINLAPFEINLSPTEIQFVPLSTLFDP